MNLFNPSFGTFTAPPETFSASTCGRRVQNLFQTHANINYSLFQMRGSIKYNLFKMLTSINYHLLQTLDSINYNLWGRSHMTSRNFCPLFIYIPFPIPRYPLSQNPRTLLCDVTNFLPLLSPTPFYKTEKYV